MAYLKHHGILGQRWGVRRGPPYPLETVKSVSATASAAAKSSSKAAEAASRSVSRSAQSKAREKAKTMTDEELRAYIQRVNLEQQYANIASNTAASRGVSYAKDYLDIATGLLGAAASAATIALAVRALKTTANFQQMTFL